MSLEELLFGIQCTCPAGSLWDVFVAVSMCVPLALIVGPLAAWILGKIQEPRSQIRKDNIIPFPVPPRDAA